MTQTFDVLISISKSW